MCAATTLPSQSGAKFGDSGNPKDTPKPSKASERRSVALHWRLPWLLCVMLVFAMACMRIGEASNPGPLSGSGPSGGPNATCCLDDPDADPAMESDTDMPGLCGEAEEDVPMQGPPDEQSSDSDTAQDFVPVAAWLGDMPFDTAQLEQWHAAEAALGIRNAAQLPKKVKDKSSIRVDTQPLDDFVKASGFVGARPGF